MLKYPSKDLIIETNFFDDRPYTEKTQSSQVQQRLKEVYKMKINKMTAMVTLQNLLKTNFLKSKLNAFYNLKSISLIHPSQFTLNNPLLALSYSPNCNPQISIPQPYHMKVAQMHPYNHTKRIKSEEQYNRCQKAEVLRDIQQKLRLYKGYRLIPDMHKTPALIKKDAIRYMHSLQIQLQHHRNRNKLASILVGGRNVAFIRKKNDLPDYLLEREKIKSVKQQLRDLRSELKQQLIINKLLQKSNRQGVIKHHCDNSPKPRNYSPQIYDHYKLLQEQGQLQQSDKYQRLASLPAQISPIKSSDIKKLYGYPALRNQSQTRIASYRMKSYNDSQLIPKKIKMIKRQIVGENNAQIYSLSSSYMSPHRQNIMPTNSTTFENSILKCLQISEEEVNPIQEGTFSENSRDRQTELSIKEKQFHGTIIKKKCFGTHYQEKNTQKDNQYSL